MTDEMDQTTTARANKRRCNSAIASSSRRGTFKRSAMGEYLPPPGEGPLSSSGFPAPSSADYHPSTQLTFPQAPQVTIKGHLTPLTVPPLPAPCDYRTSRNLVWKDNTFTLKRKDVTWPYDTRKNAHITDSQGAGQFLLINGDTGSTGQRSNLRSRHREGVQAGYPNPLVMPVDTHGFKTPGPDYRPNSPYWGRGPQQPFGVKLEGERAETLGPGSAAYDLPSEAPPAPIFGELLDTFREQDYPAPNNYALEGSVGKGPAKSFGVKADGLKPFPYPGPDTYSIHALSDRLSSGHTLNYRPFPMPVEPRPGPAAYNTRSSSGGRAVSSKHQSPPEYSLSDKAMPVFPDVLHYPEHATLNVPGPGMYKCERDFSKNSKPAYSVALPLPTKPDGIPAANHYRVQHDSVSTIPTAPAFTLRPRTADCSRPSPYSPGPAAYEVSKMKSSTAQDGWTLTPLRTTKKGSTVPGPNRYSLPRGQTCHGCFTGHTASMKGRATPLVYSGFSSTATNRLASLST